MFKPTQFHTLVCIESGFYEIERCRHIIQYFRDIRNRVFSELFVYTRQYEYRFELAYGGAFGFGGGLDPDEDAEVVVGELAVLFAPVGGGAPEALPAPAA